MTEKQEAVGKRTYAGFNERWDEKHPPVVEEPQEERLFDPSEHRYPEGDEPFEHERD